ncbi:RagB/SusD family nutrient uptake outer membrane protein [Chitinophaga filiformis]|uniref:SusD family protein n=1 Tax=Chitinophaga filiformis TaxID=104663 RepID=A0A1G7HKC9_CHIFI|nr:RagB/SusD family nutrient uptake outer membrane protein [Chitinophaga filiformis]SDF00947.1 SusD family protein [Chitinophaga filiformis]
MKYTIKQINKCIIHLLLGRRHKSDKIVQQTPTKVIVNAYCTLKLPARRKQNNYASNLGTYDSNISGTRTVTKTKIKHDMSYLFLILFFAINLNCTKLLDVDSPITNTNGENVFDENSSAIAVLTGIYTNMSKSDINTGTGWLTNISFTTGLTSDELELFDKSISYYVQYYANNISPEENTWAYIYKMIFISNSAIEHIPAGKLLSPQIRSQLLGEAKFIRALCYFYLTNIYGDVPLAITSDYKTNSLLPRSSITEIYTQIIKDLQDAKALLSENYIANDGVSETDERIRPNKSAASALLARVYLFREKYAEAELESSSLIDNHNLYELVEIGSVFLMNNREAIWQLQPVGTAANKTANTRDGQVFKLLPSWPQIGVPVSLSERLASSFEAHDLRKINWIDSIIVNGKTFYYPYKYKIGLENEPTKEYATVLRLGEQYLIRAEARIQLGKISEGISDLNIIRKRSTDLSAVPAEQFTQLSLSLSKAAALLAVENERRHELFTEWGHRWFDLKRTGRADQVLGIIKPGWQSTDQLFPLPANEIIGNPNLVGHQNPGYN